MDNVQRTIDFCAKSLIGLGVVSAIPGVLSGYFAAVTGWIFGRHLLSASDAWTPCFAAGWVLFVCFGIFLLVQWIQFVRAGRLVIRSPRLWLVSFLYIATILAGLLGLAGYLVWLSFQPEVTGVPGDEFETLGLVVFPLGFALLPLAGLVFAGFLWHHTKRSSEPLATSASPVS